MKRRLIWNDLRANKLLSFSTWAFMTLCALMTALTCVLFADLLGAMDVLMAVAHTPDLVQMHAGELDEGAVMDFAALHADAVQDAQVLRFLNLENSGIELGGHSISDSTQDNGVSAQSGRFDLLLDMDNQVIDPEAGQLYVPVCFKQMYGLKAGDEATLCGERFTIAGFVRDSQMNSMMSSSKRFVVSDADYTRLYDSGSEEYLIEFRMKPGGDADALSAAYAEAGLPANGPAVTKPLIRPMNALSDGMTALVMLLVSVVMLLISALCIRFTLLSRLEADRREIGMLKAVGVGRKEIRRLYLGKYVLLSALGAVAGLGLALALKGPMQAGLRALYGRPDSGAGSLAAALIGIAVTELLLLGSVNRLLKRTEKMSAVEALNGLGGGREKKIDGQVLLIVFVVAASTFLMAVPQNLHSTLSSPAFVTYMGIGGGDARLDIRQTEDIGEKTARTEDLLRQDGRVARFVSLQTKTFRAMLPNGTPARLTVETGDHTAFPVAYAEGRAPVAAGELALSFLCAQDLEVGMGDVVGLEVDGAYVPYTVCGIYSDITNGGKTAKAAPVEDDGPVMWSVFYLTLEDVPAAQWAADCEQRLAELGISAKVVDIAGFVEGTYGPTLKQIALAARAARLAAVVVILVVTALFANLMVARDRNDIALKKALGFLSGQISRSYTLRLLGLACAGAALGVLLGCGPGQWLAGLLLRSLGAAGFRFFVDGPVVFVLLPLLAVGTVGIAVLAGLRGIRNVKAYECCIGRE